MSDPDETGAATIEDYLLEGDVPPTEPPGACEPALPGQIDCTEHPIPGELIVQKGSTPPSGTTVALGSTITYAIAFQNVGGQAVPVDHTDHLLDVPDMGSITGQPTFVGGNGFGLALSPVTGGNHVSRRLVAGEVRPGPGVRIEAVCGKRVVAGDGLATLVALPHALARGSAPADDLEHVG